MLEFRHSEQIATEVTGALHRMQMDFYGLMCDINQAKTAPHVIYPTIVTLDGNEYCCLYGSNLQEGIAGFGKTPKEACQAFDNEWNGIKNTSTATT